MPHDTLKAWDEAKARRRGAEDPDDAALVEAELSAEIAHLRRVGVDVHQRGFFSRVLPGAVVILLAIALVFSIVAAVSSHQISIHTRNNTHQLARLQREGVISNRESCQRSNDARVASIAEKLATIKSLGKQLAFWERVRKESDSSASPPAILALFDTFVDSLGEEIETKHASIEASIESQAKVAIEPGSPRTDCARAYPFRGH
jgi:hypothetical protein